MNEAIKKRLAALEQIIKPMQQTVTIELPDGTRTEKSAAEWWDHRHEWPLADFDHQENRGRLVVCLVFAAMFDDGIIEAAADGNTPEVERLTAERDDMLKMYFGDAMP